MTDSTTSPALSTLQGGDQVGPYRVVAPLGVGGVSMVWLAQDPLLQRTVAIKQLALDASADGNQEAQREHLRAQADLQKRVSTLHKTLVRVLDMHEDPRGLFLVMEYVDGQSLESYLLRKPQPMDPRTALGIIGSVALALAALHQGGVVHRDLKPANILLPRAGGLKVCDFGLSALTGDIGPQHAGTVRYLAPECYGQGPVDGRSDLYSLGMIAYEMLAGRDLYQEAFKAVLRDQRNAALRWMKWHTNLKTTVPTLVELLPQTPPALSELVARLMEKDPARRVPSAQDVLEAIRRHFSSTDLAAPALAPTVTSPAVTAAPAGGVAPGAAVRPAPVPRPVAPTAGARPAGVEVTQEVTARLPQKKRWPWVAAGALALVVIAVGGVLGYQQWQAGSKLKELRSQAGQDYAAALEQYQQGQYAQAQAVFTRLAQDWPQDARLHDYALGHALMCQAETALAADDFAQAQPLLTQADALAARAQQSAGLDRDQVHNRLRYVETRLSMAGLMQDINDDIVHDRFTDAREKLQRIQRLSSLDLTQAESDRLKDLGARIEGQERQVQITAILAKAREMAASGQREQAVTFLDQSLKRYSSRDLQQMSQEVRNQIELDKALTELAAAQTSGDWNRAAAAARQAIKLKSDDPSLRDRLNDVLSRSAYERGRKLEDGGDTTAARAAYLEATGLAENKPAAEARRRRVSAGQQATYLKAAADAAAQGQWESAIRLYQKTLDLGPNPDAAAGLKNAQLSLDVGKASQLLDQGQLDAARDLIRSVLRAQADHPLALAQAQRLAQLQDYQTALAKGDLALKDSRYADAAREYHKALELRRTDEARQRLDDAQYEGLIAAIKREMSVQNWVTARGYVAAARKIRSTEELDKLEGDIVEAEKNK